MRDARIRFGPATPFARELRARVRAYFRDTGRSPYGGVRLWLKSLVLLASTATVVTLFLLGSGTWWQAVLFGIAAGFGIAGLGFAVQHDGGHGAYSSSRVLNFLTATVLDAIGGSSFVWHRKHNQLHHTYPNLAGVDDDIDAGFLARLAPGQKRRAIHRFQHLYLWGLYAFLSLKWMWVDDYYNVLRGGIGAQRMDRPRGKDLAVFLGGKAIAITWMLVVPILVHGLWTGLLFHLALHMTAGLTLSVVFQLAHCVEEAEFPPVPTPEGERWDFTVHQLRTAVDFSPRNPLLTWYVGGLNFQAIHHLFPRICHVHYPRLAPIVAAVCEKHDVRYRSTPTLRWALRSHFRWLKRMGAPQPASAALGQGG